MNVCLLEGLPHYIFIVENGKLTGVEVGGKQSIRWSGYEWHQWRYKTSQTTSRRRSKHMLNLMNETNDQEKRKIKKSSSCSSQRSNFCSCWSFGSRKERRTYIHTQASSTAQPVHPKSFIADDDTSRRHGTTSHVAPFTHKWCFCLLTTHT